jgi:ABC-type amino acid transport substrate-binding protein
VTVASTVGSLWLALRNRRVALLVGLATLVLVAGWWLWPRAQPPITDPTWERIQREGMIRVGLDPTYPPFETDDGNGNLSGLDVDLARALAGRLDLRVEFVLIHFDGLYDALHTGRVDVLISALPFDARQTKDVLYSPPYFNAGQIIVVRAGDSSVKGATELTGKRVAVEWGSSGDVEARRLRSQRQIKLTIQPYETASAALDALQSGAADVALVDAVTALAAAGKEGRPLQVIGPPLTDEPYIMATRRDSPALWDTLNRTLATLQQDGTMSQLTTRWF